MSNAHDGVLWLEAPDRTRDQLAAGIEAGHRSLEAAGVDMDEAFQASWKPELIEGTRQRMSERDWLLHDAWFAAAEQALRASGLDPAPHQHHCLFPAELGKIRNAEAIADLASGRALEIIPPPDPGPEFTLPPPALASLAGQRASLIPGADVQSLHNESEPG